MVRISFSALSRRFCSTLLVLSAFGCGEDTADVGIQSSEIINGTLVTQDFPVALLPNCSGVMVRDRWLLTAAHCVKTDRDATFGTSGGVTFSPGDDKDVVIDSQRRIIVLRAAKKGAVVIRYLPNGAVDLSFGTAGTSGFLPGTATAVAVDNNDRVLVATTIGSSASVARLRSDGHLDYGFGLLGRQTFTQQGLLRILSVRVDGGGSIYVAGYISTATSANSYQPFIRRMGPTGSVDKAYAPNLANIGPNPAGDKPIQEIEIDGQGRLVLLAFGWTPFLARLKVDGSIDTSFAGTGWTGFVVSSTLGRVFGIEIDSFNRILVGGTGGVARYESTGGLDLGFGSLGSTPLRFDAVQSFVASDFALTATNKLIVVGFVFTDDLYSAVVRLSNDDGRPDTYYDLDGLVYAGATEGGTTHSDVAIDPGDGSYVALGNATNGDSRLVRYRTNTLGMSFVDPYPVQVGSTTAMASYVYKHGRLDVALVRTDAPLPLRPWTTGVPLYRGAPGTLRGRQLLCLGFGNNTYVGSNTGPFQLTQVGFGTLRSAYLDVVETTAEHYWTSGPFTTKANGDSGGPCFMMTTSLTFELTGIGTRVQIQSNGVISRGEDVAASAFAPWYDHIVP